MTENKDTAPVVAPLVDVTNTSLADLLDGTDSALNRSIERLVRNLSDPDGVISAFSSFVE